MTTRAVLFAGQSVATLTPLELDLLRHLWAEAGRTVPHEELIVRVWRTPSFPLGVDVQRERNRIQRAISVLRAKLEPNPQAPIAIETIRALGYRVPLPEVTASAELRIGRLAEDTSPFVGRTDEIRRIDDWVAGDEPLLQLVGVAGSGRRRLAREALRRAALPGGAWVGTAEDGLIGLLCRFGHELGMSPESWNDAETALLALDRATRARGRTALIATDLRAPELGHLVTWLAGIHDFRVLAVIDPTELLLEAPSIAVVGLAPPELASLYTALTDGRSDGRELDAVTGGIPALVELAAATFVATGLTPTRAMLPLDTLWQHSAAPDQRLLAGAVMFRAPFDANALAAVAGATPHDLARLVRRGWVRRREGPTFELPAPVAAAVWRGMPPDERDAAESRHLVWAVAEARRLRALERGPEASRAWRTLVDRAPDLRAAFTRARRDGSVVSTDLALALDHVLARTGPASAHRALLDEALAVPASSSPGPHVDLLIARAALMRRLGRPATARADLAAAHAVLAVHGLLPTPDLLLAEGSLALGAGEVEHAEVLFERAREEATGSRMRARALGGLAQLARQRRRIDEADTLYARALEDADDAGDPSLRSRILGNHAVLLRELGRFAEAEAAHRAEIDIHYALGDLRALGGALANLGVLCADTGRVEDAYACLGRARSTLERVGESGFLGVVYLNLGLCSLALGDLDACQQSWSRALQLHNRSRAPAQAALDLLNAGLLAAARGDRQGAVSAWREARALATETGTMRVVHHAHALLYAVGESANPHLPDGRMPATRGPVDRAILDLCIAWARAPSRQATNRRDSDARPVDVRAVERALQGLLG